jgi:hypothetical protein
VPKRNAPHPPFRFRRWSEGRQALFSLRYFGKRNETGVFVGVTGKVSRFAPQHTFAAGKEPRNQWLGASDPGWTLRWTPGASGAASA